MSVRGCCKDLIEIYNGTATQLLSKKWGHLPSYILIAEIHHAAFFCMGDAHDINEKFTLQGGRIMSL
jgi:hypothetical protein